MTTPDQVIQRLKHTTVAGPGGITVETKTRILPYHTSSQGAGFADAERFVMGTQTTNIDVGDVATASAGIAGIVGSVAGSE